MSYLSKLGDLWQAFNETVVEAKDSNKVRVRARVLRDLIAEIQEEYSDIAHQNGVWSEYDEFRGYLRQMFREIEGG
jgi:hypothetical protein